MTGEVYPTANTVEFSIGHFTTFTIVAPPLPRLAITSLLVSPTKVNRGESVTITVEVANTGAVPGSRTIELWIEGELEQSQDVTLAAGAADSVTFTVTKDEAGTYEATVDGLSGSFTVTEEA